MGAAVAKLAEEEKQLRELEGNSGSSFPGSNHRPADRKNWIAGLNPERVPLNKIVWPGTHNSATNQMGDPLFVRPFTECQSLSIYDQLVLGTRLLDIRVNQQRIICHGGVVSYSIDRVITEVKRFISETVSEIIILEIRTEYGQNDPPGFDNYLEQQLGDYLIRQDNHVFEKTVAEILPKRIICFWKPHNSAPGPGSRFWSSDYLRDNWTNTDMPLRKFQNNLYYLSQQPPVRSRNYIYRVENTLTAQFGSHEVRVGVVTGRIRGYKRLFISQCFSKGTSDRLQVLSTDFIDEDFVDACVGLTWARIQRLAP